MVLAEVDRDMGNIADSLERPRFNLFHRGPKTVTLPDGQKIPVVDDVNAFAGELVAEEMENERLKRIQEQQPTQKPVAEQRRPLARIRNMVVGLAGGAVKS
jgi:hypothetical protein